MNFLCICIKTLITPAPVCANMIQKLVHTCRGMGCSNFIETNVKRQSNPLPCVQHSTVHRTYSAKHNYFKKDSKKCVHFGTTARVIRVKCSIPSPLVHSGVLVTPSDTCHLPQRGNSSPMGHSPIGELSAPRALSHRGAPFGTFPIVRYLEPPVALSP